MTGQMPGDAITDAARTAFVNFWSAVGPWIAGGHADSEDVAHEAFHAGWQAALPALPAAIAAQATTAEREACAQLAERHHAQLVRCDNWRCCGADVWDVADLIRARGGTAAALPALTAADERAKLTAVMSPEQFRKLADWFDTDDEFKEAMFPDTWSPGSRQDDVQRDLRRLADLLDGDRR